MGTQNDFITFKHKNIRSAILLLPELETEDEIKEEIYDFIYDERIGIG